MMIAIASGKGGTGKTTVSVNLAAVLDGAAQYVDCDVEEPNGHIFLKPSIKHRFPTRIPVPSVEGDKCTGCGRCAASCRFNALVCIKGRVVVFPELCHGCGGCTLACPTGAITEKEHEIGYVEVGEAGNVGFTQGCLNVGAPMSPPLIRAAKKAIGNAPVILVDAPPGTSCPMIAAVKGCDFVLLVTEPTPFGLHDLTLAVETMRQLVIPFGVVVNRCDSGDDRVVQYCCNEGIPILAEIPDDRRVAEAYSQGALLVEAVPGMREVFESLEKRICDALAKTTATCEVHP